MTSAPKPAPKPPRAISVGLGGLSGLLALAAFPPFEWWFVAVVALVPMLWHLENLVEQARVVGGMKGPAFLTGWATGFALYTGLLWWILLLDSPTLSVPWFRFAAPFLLAAFLGLYTGLAAVAMVWIRSRVALPLTLIAPAVWTVMEFVRGRGELGFPWGAIGYAAVPSLPVLQAASVIGVAGLGAWILMLNATTVAAFRSGNRWNVIFGIALLVTPIVGGSVRLANAPEEGESVRVALVQPNVRNHNKWGEENRPRIFHQLAELSREGVRRGAELVVWAETATPCYLLHDRTWRPFVEDLADSLDVTLFTGLPDYQRAAGDAGVQRITYSNTGAAFDSNGNFRGRMDKIALVPFGEYIPFSRYVPLLDRVDFGEADFLPGAESILFEIDPLPPFTALICLEAVYPHLALEQVRMGARLLVNITNDSWFGAGSGAQFHRDMAIVRCVETGCGMARGANSGISVGIDPWGRQSGETGLFVETVSVVDVRLREGETLYARLGDWVTMLSLCFTGVALLGAAFRVPRVRGFSSVLPR